MECHSTNALIALQPEAEGEMAAELCKQLSSQPALTSLAAPGSRELGILLFQSTLTPPCQSTVC